MSADHVRERLGRLAGTGACVLVLDVTLELEGTARPAMVATWPGLLQPTP